MAEQMDVVQDDEDMIEAFKSFGPESYTDGITLKQLKETLKNDKENLSDDDVKHLFDSVDVDNDNLIGIKDFLLMMMAK